MEDCGGSGYRVAITRPDGRVIPHSGFSYGGGDTNPQGSGAHLYGWWSPSRLLGSTYGGLASMDLRARHRLLLARLNDGTASAQGTIAFESGEEDEDGNFDIRLLRPGHRSSHLSPGLRPPTGRPTAAESCSPAAFFQATSGPSTSAPGTYGGSPTTQLGT